MALKIRDTDLLDSYKKAPAEKRLSIMLEYYPVFPGILRKIEKKTAYKIKAEQERIRSRSRGELGVRTQTSTISDTTAREAVTNVTVEEAFKTGEVSDGLLKGVEHQAEYEEIIRLVSIMKMDFELLEDILSGFGRDDSILIRKRLSEGKTYRVIAEEEECSKDSVRRRIARIRKEISEEIIDCLRINCSGGEGC